MSGRQQDDASTSKPSGSEQLGVYIHRPAKRSNPQGQRQGKRRKVKAATESRDEYSPFVPLLGGHEDEAAVKLRYRAFKTFWANQRRKIEMMSADVHSDVLTGLASFIDRTSSERCDGRIPTGIITLGSNVSSVGRLFSRLQEHLSDADRTRLVVLDSGDASNIKTLLKTLIRAAICGQEGDTENEGFSLDRVGPKLLPYDLDLLYHYVRQKGIEKVVIAFKDSEACDQGVFSDLISLLSSWLDRIQFVLVFGVVTSVELFEGRLSRSTVNALKGQRFDVPDSGHSVDELLAALQNQEKGGLWLGHGLSQMIAQISGDRFQSPEYIKGCVKYAYMSHFFANPLSVLLADEVPVKVLHQPRLCEAIRNLPSFRSYVDNLLDEDDTDSVRKLLDDDKNLAMEAQAQIKLGQAKMRSIFAGIECLMGIREFIGGLKGLTRTELMIQALRGELGDSKILEDLLTSIRKTPSDSLHELLGLLPEEVTGVGELSDDFDALLQRTEGSNPLRSKYDDHHSTHKTTVVGQSLKLSRTRAKLSKEDTEYTTLIERLHATLEEYLTDTFINPETLFMHEAFLTDHRAPLKDTFTPRARFVVEIGLSSPADYLGNDAGDDEDGLEHLSASQPAVSILYQLYMESGAFINIYDLWRAFYTIIGGEDGEGCDERLGLTAFYRALAELKMMGMIKPTRKKPDHLSKSTWVGL